VLLYEHIKRPSVLDTITDTILLECKEGRSVLVHALDQEHQGDILFRLKAKDNLGHVGTFAVDQRTTSMDVCVVSDEDMTKSGRQISRLGFDTTILTFPYTQKPSLFQKVL
jgi:hypothetical protein